MNDRKDMFGAIIIDNFRNEYDFLSNFYVGAPIKLWGTEFSTSEHAYQWAKTIVPDEQMAILECKTPGQVKRAGRNVTMRPDWESIRYGVMVEILYAKFTQHWGLKQKLLETGNSMLIEGNHWHDNIWGSCTCEKCDKFIAAHQNLLGRALMEIRERLQATV